MLFLDVFSGDARKELARIWLNEIDYALAPYDGVLDVLGLAVECFHDAQALLGNTGGAPSEEHRDCHRDRDTWSEVELLTTKLIRGILALKSRFEKEIESRHANEARLETLNSRALQLEKKCAEKDAELQQLRDDHAHLLENIAGMNKTSNSVLAAVNVLSEQCDRQTDQLTELTRQNTLLMGTVEQCRDTDEAKDAKSQHRHCTCGKTGKKWVI